MHIILLHLSLNVIVRRDLSVSNFVRGHDESRTWKNVGNDFGDL